MDLSRITSGLQRLFGEERHRIVFWHDPAREFEDALDSLSLDRTTLLRLDRVPALQAKIRIERDEPDQRFLLYAPFEEPYPEADWLLDIRLYSRSFRADRASLILDDLGLAEKGGGAFTLVKLATVRTSATAIAADALPGVVDMGRLYEASLK